MKVFIVSEHYNGDEKQMEVFTKKENAEGFFTDLIQEYSDQSLTKEQVEKYIKEGSFYQEEVNIELDTALTKDKSAEEKLKNIMRELKEKYKCQSASKIDDELFEDILEANDFTDSENFELVLNNPNLGRINHKPSSTVGDEITGNVFDYIRTQVRAGLKD